MVVESGHDIHVDDLSDHQRKKIKELRSHLKEELAKYPDCDTDLSMLRWLMGYDYDIETIVPKAKWALSVFHNLTFDEHPIQSAEELHELIGQQSELVPYFPGGIIGLDKDGYALYCQPMARAHPRTLIKGDSVSQLFRMELAMCEGAFKLVRDYEKRTGKKRGMKIIMDLEGFSYSELVYMPAIKEYMKLTTLLQAVFPDFLMKLWIVNPPTSITVVYNLIKPVLAKQTQEKITILGKDWKEVLVESCGAEHLFPQWGGTKAATTPFGHVKPGGKVPEKLIYSPSNNPFDDEEKMQVLNVPARGKAEVRIKAKKGELIRWLFRVNSGDIDFSVRFDDREVYPTFRLSTEFVPETNFMVARETGEYVLLFENLHGKLWAKEIKYRVDTLKDSDPKQNRTDFLLGCANKVHF